MNKLFTLAALTALAFTGVAYAADQSDIASDKGAIVKDNKAINKQDDNIATNRAEKEAAKESGDVVDQASQSAQIGANKTVKAVKQTEKKLDKKILNQHTKEVNDTDK